MDDGKLENLLNLALSVSEETREKSLDLNVGYDAEDRTWEIIVRYSQDILFLEEAYENVTVVELLNHYAIITLPQNLVGEITKNPYIQFVEKPKRLYFAVNNGRQVSCINSVQDGGAVPGYNGTLTGEGVIIGVVDSGIDVTHPDFRNEDGTTRILNLWDQTGVPEEGQSPPAGYRQGIEYTREDINEALSNGQGGNIGRDLSGHGTHVTGIAAGNGRASEGEYRGVAYESPLIIVKLGAAREGSFPKTSELMQGIDYCIRKAVEWNMPLSLNLSFGNNYGAHTGTSLLETYIDDVIDNGKTCIVIGTGNEGTGRNHTAGRLAKEQQGEETVIEFSVGQYETILNMQLWKRYADEFFITLEHPSGERIGPLSMRTPFQTYPIERTTVYVYYGSPLPYSPYQEIYFDFIPNQTYIDPGIWSLRIRPGRIVDGNYELWLPGMSAINAGTGFLNPVETTTLTIPSTAASAISVAAYNSRTFQYASFSGRGYTNILNLVKPDLAAPGVDVVSCAPRGGYTTKSGTSMAAPFVAGGAALLMQWGIVNGNDEYLYGEKVKAYLIRGARSLPGITEYPNPQIGWGTLCVADSLPR